MKFKGNDLLKSVTGLLHFAGYSCLFVLAASASAWIGGLFGGLIGFGIGAGGTAAFGYFVYPVLKENWKDFTSGISSFIEGIQEPLNFKKTNANKKVNTDQRNVPQYTSVPASKKAKTNTTVKTQRKDFSLKQQLSGLQTKISEFFAEKDPNKRLDNYHQNEPACNKSFLAKLFERSR